MPPQARRARLRLILAVVSATLMFVAALLPTWIEEFTTLEPDRGTGALEWLLPLPLAAAALTLGALIHRTGRRTP
ncbi:hypothetical protein GCM10010168_81380 [Actinoplanes ianthinogenes]|uniref:ABC transporter permease n=1 Tax=Actinoplanes ianthinogenes TaxID=122358 RepID=A0ABM7LMP0_9ACTN|nr:hypothetical protein Aiant_11850 [Actinoplanes ianthinogenes]GGR50327.1 hypothetical protein GCM10010168_81380 [Actinoplanes ianthinogenes]